MFATEVDGREMCLFESNKTGDYIAKDLDSMLFCIACGAKEYGKRGSKSVLGHYKNFSCCCKGLGKFRS